MQAPGSFIPEIQFVYLCFNLCQKTARGGCIININNKPTVIAVSGEKNSGKTTLIERLLPMLADEGIKTAVIKHDGHEFVPDTAGTDTFRFFAAGACGTAIFDSQKSMVTRHGKTDERELMRLFPQSELILLEGFKHSDYPKLELCGEKSACDRETLVAIVSDSCKNGGDITVFKRDDIEGVFGAIVEFMKRGKEDA